MSSTGFAHPAAPRRAGAAWRLRPRLAVALAALALAPGLHAAEVPALVKQGAYLARAGNCISCHTTPGGEPFAGGLAFPTGFGTIYSTNITPDRETGIGGWTLAQFEGALRRGVRPDGQHLYPAFPYADFTRLEDADIGALYAYFMKVKPVRAPAKANDMKFPFGMRSLLGSWKALYFDEGRFVPDAAKPAQWNRGAYLVQGLAHCGECHSPRGMLGATKQDAAFTGGVLRDVVEDGHVIERGAPNLTSTPHGLAAWSEDDIAGYLHDGVNTRTRLMGTMNEVVLNSTRHLTPEDDRAIAVYIKSLAPAGKPAGKPDDKVMQIGAKQYDIHCGTCHLPTGLGGTDTGPPLKGSAFAQSPAPASLIDLVLNGPRLPPVAPSDAYRRPWVSMEPFSEKLSDADAAALFTFVRNSWGNAAGEVKPAQVEALR